MFNEEMRQKLAEATKEYLDDPQKRVKLNQVIMDIQRPYEEALKSIKEIIMDLGL